MVHILTRHRGERRASADRAVGLVCGLLVGLVTYGLATPAAQRATTIRKVATVPLLLAYPGFYHTQPVRVAGHLVVNGDTAQLFTNEKNLLLLMPAGLSSATDAQAKAEAVEVTGTFFDVGRTEPSDGRLSTYDLRALSQRILRKDWPGFGELPTLLVDAIASPQDATPSVRTIALSPDRFADQTVTVLGRFRGRNLFGDMPAGPGKSQWDFVLQSADAALWVTGRRPRGKDFDLRLDSRVDTGRWLEVTGTVRTDGVRTWVEATDARLGTAPVEQPVEVVEIPAAPPPRVVFSAPVEGEIDVELGTSIRIQFSREMSPATFKGSVSVVYVPAPGAPGAPIVPVAPMAADLTYDETRRTLEIRLRERPEPLRTLRVNLGPGIAARDGAILAPWTLTFTLGG